MKKYIVLHSKGERIGSFPLSENNRRIMAKLFATKMIQIDVSGTEHYEIYRVPTNKEIKENPL